MLGAEGGVEAAVRYRVRCAWSKFYELVPILTRRGVSLKLKGKFYRACVQSVLLYGSDTWAIKVEDDSQLVGAEKEMARWTCGVSLQDRIRAKDVMMRLGIEVILNVVRRGRLRWLGQVECKDEDDWVLGRNIRL